MKTRDQIYSKEAAELLRDITTYHYIQHNQLLKLYPGKENKIDNLLSYLVRQGRIFYEPERDMYHDGMEAFPDMHIISALWVLIEFIEKVDYHSLSDFPITLIFIADGELYEVIYVASENEALLEHALTQINHDAEKRIVIVESTDQIAKLSIPDVTAYCTTDMQTGTVSYFTYKKEDEIG